MTEEQTEGWFFPTNARKAHYDPGNTEGVALCGRWGRIGFGGRAAPITDGPDAPPSSDDCVACRRKLEGGRR